MYSWYSDQSHSDRVLTDSRLELYVRDIKRDSYTFNFGLDLVSREKKLRGLRNDSAIRPGVRMDS